MSSFAGKIQDVWSHLFDIQVALVVEQNENNVELPFANQYKLEYYCSGFNNLTRNVSPKVPRGDVTQLKEVHIPEGKRETRSRSSTFTSGVSTETDEEMYEIPRSRSNTTTTEFVEINDGCHVDDFTEMNRKSANFDEMSCDLGKIANDHIFFNEFMNTGEYWRIHLNHYMLCTLEGQKEGMKCLFELNKWFDKLTNVKSFITAVKLAQNLKIMGKIDHDFKISKNMNTSVFSRESAYEPTWNKIAEKDPLFSK
jgi:hypothetical protein